jgi:hypothetical protein
MKPRRLEFNDFDDVNQEAERLLNGTYQKAGTWDLAQVCNHLADAMTLSATKGVRPMASLPVRWYIRWRYLNKVLQSRKLPSGVKAPEEVRAPASGDPAAAVQRLREAVAQCKAHQGEYKPHPYFGYLKPDQARQFHLIHCAHHFSFLVPDA